jgi:hypothetical protein
LSSWASDLYLSQSWNHRHAEPCLAHLLRWGLDNFFPRLAWEIRVLLISVS